MFSFFIQICQNICESFIGNLFRYFLLFNFLPPGSEFLLLLSVHYKRYRYAIRYSVYSFLIILCAVIDVNDTASGHSAPASPPVSDSQSSPSTRNTRFRGLKRVKVTHSRGVTPEVPAAGNTPRGRRQSGRRAATGKKNTVSDLYSLNPDLDPQPMISIRIWIQPKNSFRIQKTPESGSGSKLPVLRFPSLSENKRYKIFYIDKIFS